VAEDLLVTGDATARDPMPDGEGPHEDPADQGLEAGPLVPRGAVALQIGGNIAGLRRAAGLTAVELAGAADVVPEVVIRTEEGKNTPTILNSLRLAGVLGTSIDTLTAGAFWNPGASPASARTDPRTERVAGYFSTEPEQVRKLLVGPPVDISGDRTLVASIIGRNVRDARRRRHLRQCDLGIPQTRASKIERGSVEPGLDRLIDLARRLEVPVGSLLAGMYWGEVDLGVRASAGRRREPRSLDAVVARRCRQGESVPGIADELLIRRTSVEKMIARLRREGRNLGPYGVTPGKEFLLTHADIADEIRLEREGRAAESDPLEADAVKQLVGTTVRGLRRRAGLSQEALAAAAGVNRASVSEFERKGLNYSLTHLIRLAASLRVPCSTLVPRVRWDAAASGFVLDADREPAATPGERIGRNARRIRQGAGLSESTIARRVGRSDRSFNAVERGKAPPRPMTLLMLAAALRVEVDALLVGVDDWYHRALPPIAVPEADEAVEQAARQSRLLRLWDEGADLVAIGEAVDLKPNTVFGVINRLREIGVEVPYRRPPSNAAQLSSRLRRRRRGISTVATA
jgi:transcriptional regulator with XRE-family HTH domain